MNTIKAILLCIYRLPFRELGVLVLAGTIIFILLYYTTKMRKWQRSVLLTLSAAYALIIICATLLGRRESSASHGVSLVPFASYLRYVQGQTEMLRESIMNIVFFYPLGLLLGGAASEKLPRKKALVFAFFLSLFIEFCQWLFNLGYAEVDDVIHNTLGAAIGLLAIYFAEKTADFVNFKHRRPH